MQKTSLSEFWLLNQPSGTTPLQRHMWWVEQLADAGGPTDSAVTAFSAWIAELQGMIDAGQVSRTDWFSAWKSFTSRKLPQTMGARALAKPHGYAGDFETIDAIYNQRTAEDVRQQSWDAYFHSQAAPVAVRNRKNYFQRTVTGAVIAAARSEDSDARILNIASGPGRD